MEPDSIAVSLKNVTQRFQVIQERPDTVRELFTRFFRPHNTAREFEAVRNVSLNINKGQVVGLIGKNGSGKSTLLKIIAGIYQPSAGSVEVHGSLAPLLELGAGFHHELSGRENILLNGLLLGFSKREMLAREQGIIDFAEIGDFIDAPVKQYSSGMYTRLAFAVATEINPDVLVIDEILAVGDIGFQEKCFDRLEQFRKAGKTIIFVSHTPSHLHRFCDRAILLDKGSVAYDGLPDDAFEIYERRVGTYREHAGAIPGQ